VLRMDSATYPNEVHAYPEALIVLKGRLNLQLVHDVVAVGPGEVFIVPPGLPHAVAHGSHGTLVIIDA
jgi:quercetin dioxygenase-like cupin family protein